MFRWVWVVEKTHSCIRLNALNAAAENSSSVLVPRQILKPGKKGHIWPRLGHNRETVFLRLGHQQGGPTN